MNQPRSVAIVGGGITGPVAALALRRAGIDARIYEAGSRPDDRQGGSIALAPNGIEALDIVGAKSGVLAASTPIHTSRMSMSGARPITLPALPDQPPMRLIQRGDLYRILSDLLADNGIEVATGKRLVSVDERPDAARLRFADDTDTTADLVIGADGVHSVVRRMIDPHAPGPRSTGMLGFEGLAGSPDCPPGTMTFAFGERAYYLYFPMPGGTGWGANLPYPEELSRSAALRTPAAEWLGRLAEAYAGDDPGAELVRATDPDRLQIVGSLHIMPPVPQWYRGRMVLAGDSVHAPSNSSGQGASLGIESAIQLAQCLRDLEPPDALDRYVRLRRSRVEGIAASAAKVNRTKAPGRFARAMMPIAMPLLQRTAMRPEKTLGPVQRYRIDWDATISPAMA